MISPSDTKWNSESHYHEITTCNKAFPCCFYKWKEREKGKGGGGGGERERERERDATKEKNGRQAERKKAKHIEREGKGILKFSVLLKATLLLNLQKVCVIWLWTKISQTAMRKQKTETDTETTNNLHTYTHYFIPVSSLQTAALSSFPHVPVSDESPEQKKSQVINYSVTHWQRGYFQNRGPE